MARRQAATGGGGGAGGQAAGRVLGVGRAPAAAAGTGRGGDCGRLLPLLPVLLLVLLLDGWVGLLAGLVHGKAGQRAAGTPRREQPRRTAAQPQPRASARLSEGEGHKARQRPLRSSHIHSAIPERPQRRQRKRHAAAKPIHPLRGAVSARTQARPRRDALPRGAR